LKYLVFYFITLFLFGCNYDFEKFSKNLGSSQESKSAQKTSSSKSGRLGISKSPVKRSAISIKNDTKKIRYYGPALIGGTGDVYLHYERDNGTWDELSGRKMTKNGDWYEILILDKGDIEFSFSDGDDHWDSKYGQNYHSSENEIFVKYYNMYYGSPKKTIKYYAPGETIMYLEYEKDDGEWIEAVVMKDDDGDGWFEVEIEDMGEVEFAFRDSAGNYDSKYGENYKSYEEETLIKQYEVYTGSMKKKVHYYAPTLGFSNVYLHYRDDEKNWTLLPGIPMNNDGMGWYSVEIDDLGDLEFAFNDGAGNWDSDYANNYYTSSKADVWVKHYTMYDKPMKKKINYHAPSATKIDLHYQDDDGNWAAAGIAMTGPDSDGWWSTEVEDFGEIPFAFFDGTTWDSKYGANYFATTESVHIKNYTLYENSSPKKLIKI